jgi:hypothetical protein
VVTKLAIVDDLQILLVSSHIANYAKFQPFFAVMALFLPVIFMGLEVSSSQKNDFLTPGGSEGLRLS